ncbi:MAG: ABC-2 family transporter protein [Planctomycetales bacterium]|nr:ABC-2 family transporter protein [Planctomycetales bacterium]
MNTLTSYLRLYIEFLRNALVREMTFRANFIIECISSMSWVIMNIGFYQLVFLYAKTIGDWPKWEFFVFLATTLLVNSIVQTFFMPNAENFSELIRQGGLDFLLLKPVDTQFMMSLQRVDWSGGANFVIGLVLLAYSLFRLTTAAADPLVISLWMLPAYVFYVLSGVAIMYSLMISLAASSIWLGRNQSLYDFWFYITNFSRYPMEIYGGNALGTSLRVFFLFIVPVLVVINVPARIMAKGLISPWLAAFALAASITCLAVSRLIFQRALRAYRSASS